MTSAGANKLVAGFAVGGVAFALWTSPDAQTRYRHVWGVTLLSLAGAAFADLAPSIVGPFFGLVIVAAIAGHSSQIGTLVSGVKRQAGVKK